VQPTVGTAVSVTTWMTEVASAVEAEADHLTQLDSAIGDGDHGVNMTRGFRAVLAAMEEHGDADAPGRQLILAGKTLVSTVGGASGPLWGLALRRAGRALGDAGEMDGAGLLDALEAALAAVVELGAAEPGDKTAIEGAAEAADAGARSTTPMQARKGRASYLGERSVGHQDPGATSTALIVRALGRAIGQPG
jgi:dihydroxyacetone kinase-like protein